jgi:hypothetical protein
VQHWVYAGIHLYLHLPAIHAYTNTQTNAHSETPYDTEAAPDSAAKAHALTGRYNDCQWFVALTNES